MLNAATANHPRKPLQSRRIDGKTKIQPTAAAWYYFDSRSDLVFLSLLFICTKKNRACLLAELKSKLKLNFIIHFLTARTMRASTAFVDGCSAIWHLRCIFHFNFIIYFCRINGIKMHQKRFTAGDSIRNGGRRQIYTIKLMLHRKNK